MPSLQTSLAATAILLARLSLAQSITFDFLTYNVAGLPDIINDNEVPGDKAEVAGMIGSKLAEGAYDVVHLQEDFNYHAYIYETDDHPERTPTTGGVPFGSGLNTVANYAWTEFEQIKWDRCNLNSGDCLTPKGFSFMRTQFDSGLEVDFYNLHADAGGSDEGDRDARRAGINQLIAYMNTASAGRAVIIGGDTNDRYTNSGRSITLLTDAGFVDPWVELAMGGAMPAEGAEANACSVPAESSECEIVDKVLYRSGDSVTLTATEFSYESDFFTQPDGSILSDHNPVRVVFEAESV